MNKVTCYPDYTHTPDSISFCGLSKEEAERLALAFATCGFYVKTWDTQDTDVQNVVSIRTK